MTITKEISLEEFEAWGGAVETLEALESDEIELVEQNLEELFPAMSEDELNDFLWFEDDTIAEWLGYVDWDDYMAHKK